MKSQFQALSNTVLSERIVNEVLSMIRERKLMPGDKLPPERELAAALNVSRPSLREALRALSIMGIVEIRQGAGTFVTSLETDLLVQHLDFVFSLDTSTFVNLFEARQILEVGIAAMAAQRITDDEIEQLQAFMETSHCQVHEESATFLQADHKLHTMIAEFARNPILLRFFDVVNGLGSVSRQRRRVKPEEVQRTVVEHQAIVDAIVSRDPEAAQQAMMSHLESGRQRLLRDLEDAE